MGPAHVRESFERSQNGTIFQERPLVTQKLPEILPEILGKNRLLLQEMAVLGPETRPDGPGLTGSSVFRPDPAKLTLPGPVRPTFGLFRCRPSRPSGCKSVGLTTGLRPHGPDGFPGAVAGPLPASQNKKRPLPATSGHSQPRAAIISHGRSRPDTGGQG